MRDMEIMLAAAVEVGIPVIVGTDGGLRRRAHIQWIVDIFRICS
jgi:hypothetical protein